MSEPDKTKVLNTVLGGYRDGLADEQQLTNTIVGLDWVLDETHSQIIDFEWDIVEGQLSAQRDLLLGLRRTVVTACLRKQLTGSKT